MLAFRIIERRGSIYVPGLAARLLGHALASRFGRPFRSRNTALADFAILAAFRYGIAGILPSA